MRIVLNAAVYTANRGYAWSNVPEGTTTGELEELLALATSLRPEFPTEADVACGAVASARLTAVFSLRTVPAWDAEGRAADYAAFVLVDREIADKVDFGVLLGHRFFAVPLKTPPPFVMYDGPDAQVPPLDAAGRLLSHNRLANFPLAQAGALLAEHGTKSAQWSFRADPATGCAEVRTAPWRAAR